MTETDTSVRIKSIEVKGLFGLYDHKVTLKADRVTVIHGPNGVGKTALLKLTNSFLRGRYNEIIRTPFQTFEIVFDEGSIAAIQVDTKSKDSEKIAITFRGATNPENETVTVEGDSLNTQRIAKEVAELHPYLSQVGPEEWLDRTSGEIVTADEIVALADDLVPKRIKDLVVAREPEGLRELRGRINVHLIEAQRLIRLSNFSADWEYRINRGKTKPITTVTVQEYSQDLKQKLQITLANYAKQSQMLDQTFPQRLLKAAKPQEHESVKFLKEEMEKVEATRKKLQEIGILDRNDSVNDENPLETSQIDSMKQDQWPVMLVYAQDTKKKLSVLEEISGRIEILLDVLNRKFTNKTVAISKDDGLVIRGKDNKPIPVAALS
jgi:energy-coupling factor transporter ATP-binding protein EcfA2